MGVGPPFFGDVAAPAPLLRGLGNALGTAAVCIGSRTLHVKVSVLERRGRFALRKWRKLVKTEWVFSRFTCFFDGGSRVFVGFLRVKSNKWIPFGDEKAYSSK